MIGDTRFKLIENAYIFIEQFMSLEHFETLDIQRQMP